MEIVTNNLVDLKSSIKLVTGRLIKHHFGKGPDRIAVTIGNQRIIVELYGLLNKAEKKVLGNEEAEKAIKQYWQLLLAILWREVDPMERVFGFPVNKVFFDFLPSKNKCYVIIDFEESKNFLKELGSFKIEKYGGRCKDEVLYKNEVGS